VVINLDHYRTNIPAVKRHCDGFLKEMSVDRCVTEIAISTHCPCIVIAHYVGELYGFTDEVNDVIDRLTKFYGYTEIRGKK
jgi:hypothetical protein